MLYPFMTLNDGTEIVHSETIEVSGKETVEVRIEKPVYGGFHSATCWLPEYRWENVEGFSQEDIHYFQELLESVAHIILQLAREGGIEGGFDDASGFLKSLYTRFISGSMKTIRWSRFMFMLQKESCLLMPQKYGSPKMENASCATITQKFLKNSSGSSCRL